ncbi:MAG: LysM peptidoglycan-binding domain-containing protein [Myxococcota bacterium]|nr:LysM peptidoglycan-binding domain-containing protein [Myxococcota bacterium]
MRSRHSCMVRLLLTGLLLLPAFSAHSQRIMLSSERRPEVPEEYLVEKGDTLWDICEYYFAEPRRWPTIWALNPHITNPHWIYPGDILRLRMPQNIGPDGIVVDPFNYTIGSEDAQQVTINEGFIIEKAMKPRGTLAYSPQTQRYLALDDLVYLEVSDLQNVRVGQKFSVYEIKHDVVHPETDEILGQKVRIKGVVEVQTVDKNMARARIIASYGELERGMPIIELINNYVVVNPRQNLIDMQGAVVDALKPARELGQFDTVFIDRGSKDGVQIGNRFFVMRRGDGRFDYDRATNQKMPWEQIGEALVVLTKDRTSTALVTRSALEIRRGDRVIMQRHY